MIRQSILKSTLNTRFITLNGEYTRTIRSDQIDTCSKSEILYLQELGICAIIDLRDLEGCLNICSPHISQVGIHYYNIPVKECNIYEYFDSMGVKNDVDSRRIAKADYYVHLLETNLEVFYKIFSLWNKYKGKVLIHCAIGRDRTGIISAIIQHYIGCSDEEIIREYAISARNLKELPLEADKYIDYETALKIGERFLMLAKKQNLLNFQVELTKKEGIK